MNQLTHVERSLIAQFETLVNASETSLKASKSTFNQLQKLSKTMLTRLEAIERRQDEIQSFQMKLAQVLNEQSSETENLLNTLKKYEK